MNYHNKYIKYKKKYIELKYNNNQYGGTNTYICVPNTAGKFPTYIECKNDKSSPVAPVAQVAPAPLVAHPLGFNTAYINPWNNRNSRLLFIALPIAQSSELGKRITAHFTNISQPDPFNDYDKNIKVCKSVYTPHITLINISIPEGSKLDTLLSNKTNFNSIANIITQLFINHFYITTAQLHSTFANYETLGKFIARVYDDKAYLQVVSEYNKNFRQAIINELISKIIPPKTTIITHTGKSPGHIPNPPPKSVPTFTHYSINSKPPTESEFAIANWFTENWIPHMSLINMSLIKLSKSTPIDIITQIKHAAAEPISFINLWPVNKTKTIPQINKSEPGSLEYIFVSYNNTHKIYLKI